MKMKTSKYVRCATAVLRGKFIAINAYIKKRKGLKSVI